MDGNLAMNSQFENMSEKDSNDMADHYSGMTHEDYVELDRLLDKLQIEMKCRIIVCPYYIQDLSYVGVYNSAGNLIDSSHGLNVEDCINKIKEKRNV